MLRWACYISLRFVSRFYNAFVVGRKIIHQGLGSWNHFIWWKNHILKVTLSIPVSISWSFYVCTISAGPFQLRSTCLFVYFSFLPSYCYRHSNRLTTPNCVNHRPSWIAMPFRFPWMQCNESVCIQTQAVQTRQLAVNHPHVHDHGMILAGRMMLIKFRYQKCKYQN